jgi:hypothetical protein
MTEFKLDHKITEEDVKKLNELLAGSGWTVGKLWSEFFYLEMDIKRAGQYGYTADDLDEMRRLYELKASLQNKQDKIFRDLKEEVKHD